MSAFPSALDFTLNLEGEHGHEGIREALQFTLPAEGGEVNDPDDPGGHTNHGITQTTYSRWQRSKGVTSPRSVHEITMGEVCLIYDEEYWEAGRCGIMPTAIGCAHFDACVNFGPTGALEILQRALGVTDDGRWGPVTEHVLGSEPPLVLLENMCWERVATYADKVHDVPVKEKFFLGWTKRVVALRRYARTLHFERSV